MSPPRALGVVAALAGVGVALAACGSAGEPRAGGADAAASGVQVELTVFAAASLQGSFDEIARLFEAENPGIDVQPIVYDGSSTLAAQIAEGAPADVFAAADEATMAGIGDLATTTDIFATNTLVVAVPEGNPGDVQSIGDLGDPQRTVVLCAPEVPCGAAAERLLAGAGVRVDAASYEQNVAAVLTKVAADEADAGLVYATDVVGRPVESFVPEGAADVVNRYPIAPLEGSADPAAAEAFVAFVVSGPGRAVLEDRGFGAP